MNEQRKERREWKNERRAVRRDGGNEDELMSCWQTLFTLSGEMTEGRSYRRKHKALKKHSRWAAPLQAFNLALFKVCSESPRMRGARENERGGNWSNADRRKGCSRGGEQFSRHWMNKHSLVLIQSPLPQKLHYTLYPKHTHWTNYKHSLAAKSWGPRRVTARTGPEPQHGRGREKRVEWATGEIASILVRALLQSKDRWSRQCLKPRGLATLNTTDKPSYASKSPVIVSLLLLCW